MIVILGNTNDENGRLSAIAISRCEKAIEIWNIGKNKKILSTGGFGSHFNTTSKAHFEYLNQYLIDNQVFKSQIISGINSSNTFQDLVGVKEMIFKHKPNTLEIITSDFHYGRVKFYVDLIFSDINYAFLKRESITIIGTSANLDSKIKESLIEYEKNRMDKILDFPSDIYQNASQEQKHYDNVSIAMITGQYTAFVLGFKIIIEKFNGNSLLYSEKIVFIVVLFFIISLFWCLYLRAAETARSARLILRIIERNFSQYGFSLSYSVSKLKDNKLTFKRILELIYLMLSIILFAEINVFLSIIFLFFYFTVTYFAKAK